jgi:exodeoxyribonuclease V alpha subunit
VCLARKYILNVDASPSESGLKAEVTDIQFRNDENGWTVLTARNQSGGQVFPAVGVFSFIRVGEVLELFGQWTEHKKFGKQFKIDRSVALRPKSPKDILKYLGSGLIKGIGPKTARCIVDHFGEATLDVLDKNPSQLLQVPKIGKKKLEQILEAWDLGRGERELQMFLATHNISPHFAAKVAKKYGATAHRMIAANPYRLATDISGIGFQKADRIAMSLGIPEDSPDRMKAAVLYLLKQAADSGHCFLTTNDLVKTLHEKLALPLETLMAKISQAIIELNQDALLVTDTILGQDFSAHYLPALHRAELRLAANIRQRIVKGKDDLQNQGAFCLERMAHEPLLSPRQKEAVINAVTSRCFILTGGPGVGKTTTANSIIKVFAALQKRILLCAPTGRAAQRLAEVSGNDQAKTIHRLLEWTPEIGTFARNSENLLACDVLILDEASMLDLNLADAIFDAMPLQAQVILIGDADQLPSVGPGNILRHLIESKCLSTVHLDEIFRQGRTSDIVEYAHMINRGITPEFRPAEDSDCLFLQADSSQAVLERIKSLFTSDFFRQHGLDEKRDVQVLSPMNKGELGTTQINLLLQELLNPDQTKLTGIPGVFAKQEPSKDLGSTQETTQGQASIHFRLGDKVIQTSNNYDLGVFNGDIGWIVEKKGRNLSVAFGDRIVGYTMEHSRDLQLAYAISIHKSQGSEFPAVLLITSMSHYIMLQRNLYYTGLTRARTLAVFIGSHKAIQQAVRTQTSLNRRALLLKRLQQ